MLTAQTGGIARLWGRLAAEKNWLKGAIKNYSCSIAAS